MAGLTLRAHAKINLNLKVLGRRPDGLHELESVLQTVTLHDTLTVEPAAGGLRLDVEGASIPDGPANLVWRAAESALACAGRPKTSLRLRLRKRIPVGAGLGGGSSDAAATLLAVNRVSGLDLPISDLAVLAADLGSDVPFFLCGGTALLTGSGSDVHPLPDVQACRLLLVHPRAPLATADVYGLLQAPLTPPSRTDSIKRFECIAERPIETWVGLGNDLESSASHLCPAIAEIKEGLLGARATAAAVTGSGAALFGVFRDEAALITAARTMAGRGWWVTPSEPLSRAEYRRQLRLS